MPSHAPRPPRSILGLLALLALGALTSLSGACRSPTSITLEITTDVKCSDLRGIAIVSSSRDGAETASPATTTSKCTAIDATRSRIGSLVIVPSDALDAAIGIRVVAGIDRPVDQCSAATGYAGCIVARRTLRFQPRAELTLPIELHLDCKGVACGATSTCVAGTCRSSTLDDPDSCSGEGCLGGFDGGVDASPPDSTPDTSPDAATDGPPADAPISCGTTEKNCGDSCVSNFDPAYGCSATSCSPCDQATHSTYVCVADACKASGCAAGYKSCGGACVPTDADHGCGAASCAACPAANGVPSCEAGACKLTCNTGYKLCGGKCVNIGDPNFGCGATTCDNSSCPPSGGGTVICSGSSCVLGACSAGTKACAGTCVPTDTTHGCGDVTRCTACALGETCVGGPPTTCQCVPESKATTCARVQCGVTTNNCGQSVDCGTAACVAPKTCGGGGLKNSCGCTPVGSPCDGVKCGKATDSCGNTVSCGCTGFQTCGGGGTFGICGCTPTNPCVTGSCGLMANGCGGVVSCGKCFSPQTCGGGGVANRCGCTPADTATACAAVGQVCGNIADGCSCGTCSGLTTKCCTTACVKPAFECPPPF